MTYKMNVLTYRLGREPIPTESDPEINISELEADSEADSEEERIAEQYSYTDDED